MKKYNCNNTLDYVHEFNRMCGAFNECSGCPLTQLHCELYEITPEHINRVQAWSDAHPKITLTDKQVEIFKALNLLGFRYIAKDADGAVYAFTERPGKGLEAWGGNGEYFSVKVLRSEVSAAISALVNWNDDEPLCIAEALEQAEETKQ